MSPKIMEKLFTFRDVFLSIWASHHHFSRQWAFLIIIPCPTPRNRTEEGSTPLLVSDICSAAIDHKLLFRPQWGMTILDTILTWGWGGIHSLPLFTPVYLQGLMEMSTQKVVIDNADCLWFELYVNGSLKANPSTPIKTIPHAQTFSGNCA